MKRIKFVIKTYMNSDIPLETTAIFFLANLYLKQGIGYVYVVVNFISMGLLDMWGVRIEYYKMKNHCPQSVGLQPGTFRDIAKNCTFSSDMYWSFKC